MPLNKFSRLVALLMALCLTLSLFAACAQQEQVPPEAEVIAPTEAPTEPPTEAPTEAPTEPPTEAPTEPDPDLFVADGNVNPLTGLCDGISDEALNTRPVAVMINNMIKALPQWGISQADIIYEMLAEGRITRFLAIFQDHSKIDKLASIRSARPYYIDIAQSYGAVYIHFGGSVPAYDAIAKRSDLISIDGIKGSWEGTVFFRDAQRKKQMGLEHSVYTTGEYLDLAMEKLVNQGKDLNQTEHPSAFKFGDRWHDNSAVDGEPANKVTITFSSSHKPWFQYDAETEKYLRFQYGDPQMDGVADTQLAIDNVLVLRMTLTELGGELKLVEVGTTGKGDGYFFTKGKYVPITWEKETYNSEIKYYTLDGEELVVSRGQTFVSVITTTADIVIE
ncbi:MAG: DUF3048 domain-containing protein [Clostridia bacterium]|nr:DUF3048 domain-containing protein [Clostridia bacterium]